MTRPAAPPLPPELWMMHLFSAKAARQGGVVRRKARDVERSVGRAAFEAEVARRGWQAVENAGQIIVFCNAEPIRPLGRGQSLGETLPESF